jgi:8-oxo-dGTP pyrophosphatase MutT (NUDIX family)
MSTFFDSNNLPVELPEGQEVYRRISAYALVLNDKNQILLVLPTWRDSYDVPGGGIEAHETIPEGIIRECYEEAGYKVLLDSDVPMHVSETNFYHTEEKKFYRSTNMYYKGSLQSDVQDTHVINTVVPNEISKVEWVNLKDLASANIYDFHSGALEKFAQSLENL